MGNWTPEQEKRLKELYDKFGNNYSSIIKKLEEEFNREFTWNSVRNKIRRSSIIEYIPNKRGEGIFEGLDEEEQFNDYVEAKSIVKQVINDFDDKYGDSSIKILAISDLHIPHIDLDALEKVLLNNQDADVLVIAGDLLDFDSLSVYGNKKEISVEEEYKMLFNILEKVAPIFNNVYIHEGNHCKRFKNYIKRKVVTALSGYLTDKHRPLKQVTKYFENVTYVPHWFLQLGDVVFAHPSRYSKIPLRSARNVVRDRINKDHSDKFDDFSTVLIGHTHRLGKTTFHNKVSAEIGCLQKKDVEFRNNDAKGKEWKHGYCTIEMENGKSDWNSISVKTVEG